MLLNNGTWFGRLRPVAGPLRSMGLLGNARNAMLRDNLLSFGGRVSVPNGYQSAYRAVVPTFKETEFMAVTMRGEGSVGFAVQGVGSLAVSLEGESSTVFNGQMGGTLGVTMSGEGSMTAYVRGIGSMGVSMDAGSRPSAFDIAQEVWQSQKVSYNATGTMGNALNNAASGGVDYAALGEAVWAALKINNNDVGSMGEALQAASAPTATENADQVRINLTPELARILQTLTTGQFIALKD